MTDSHFTTADLPTELALFPLRDAVLLPRGRLPLNVFEPRYLAMIEYALAHGRMIGLIRPRHDDSDVRPPLYSVGCAGRIVSFAETGDGRIVLTLGGVSRFCLLNDDLADGGFRIGTVDYSPFIGDPFTPDGDRADQRERLVATLHTYLKAMDLSADWDSVEGASVESIVNAIAMACPFDADESQALLEASDVSARADALIAMMEMEIAAADSGDGGDGGEHLQ